MPATKKTPTASPKQVPAGNVYIFLRAAMLDPYRRHPGRRSMAPWLVLIGIALDMTGCNSLPARLGSLESAPSTIVAQVITKPELDEPSQPKPVYTAMISASGPDESYDPFVPSEQTSELQEHDPWKPFNMVMFEFNRKVDTYALKPVAQAYDVVLPDAVQVGVGNFFHHVRVVPRLMNNLFQAKAKGAGIELGRFFINSTVGIAGFFDPAKQWWELDTPDEDSGQMLGVYGMKPGPYLVLPFFPPLTLRDGLGYVADMALDPVTWLVFVVPSSNQTTYTIARFGAGVGQTLNDRSLNLEMFEGVEDTTLDLYAAVRNAYLQKRARAVLE
ncbi:MAG: VacJ family lipoprotein [Nitrospira sp.]